MEWTLGPSDCHLYWSLNSSNTRKTIFDSISLEKFWPKYPIISLLSTGKHSTAKTFCKWQTETRKEYWASSSITLLGWKGTTCELKNTRYFAYYRLIHLIADKQLPPTETDIEICINSYLFPTTLFLAGVIHIPIWIK